MTRNPYYQLKYISGVPYLMAFGQANADLRADLRLNETFVYIWNVLETTSSIEELISRCAKHFQWSDENYSVYAMDIHTLIKYLYHQGILLPDKDYAPFEPLSKTLKFGNDLYCKLYGPYSAFSEDFAAFETTAGIPATAHVQEIYVRSQTPVYNKQGRLILQNKSLSVLEGEDCYYLFFPLFEKVTEAHLSFDGKHATIFCNHASTVEGRNEIFFAMRTIFLYFARIHNMLAIHSASILYRDKVWLFSAPSGIGKTTHVNYWHELFNTPLLNGDLNLITMEHGTPVVHGIPWCGTSDIFDTKTYPLGGIIFIKRGSTDKVEQLSDDQKRLFLLHRNISPAWTADMHTENLNILEPILDNILLCRLVCTKSENSALCMQQAIDAYLDK